MKLGLFKYPRPHKSFMQPNGFTDGERKVLELLKKNHVLTKGEFARAGIANSERAIQRLKEQGYITSIESMGNSLVITQKGMRASE